MGLGVWGLGFQAELIKTWAASWRGEIGFWLQALGFRRGQRLAAELATLTSGLSRPRIQRPSAFPAAKNVDSDRSSQRHCPYAKASSLAVASTPVCLPFPRRLLQVRSP